MKTSDLIASELAPDFAANNASVGTTNRRLAYLGDGQGNVQPPTLLTPRDVYYRSDLDGVDRGVAILHPSCPIMIEALDGYANTQVWIGNMPGSSEVYVLDIADTGLRSTNGATPAEGLIRAGAFPSQDRLAILRLRPSPRGGLSLVIDVGVYSIAYEIPAGGYDFLSTAEVDASDPTNAVVFTEGGLALTSGQHCILGIAFNPTLGALIAIQGAPATAADPLPSRSEFVTSDYSALDFTGLYPAGYAYSYFGQTDFVEDDCLRLYDPRLILNRMASGGSGLATLAAGTVVVSAPMVTASSLIFLTPQETGLFTGSLRVSARVAGVSFTILSTVGTDTAGVAWQIIEP